MVHGFIRTRDAMIAVFAAGCGRIGFDPVAGGASGTDGSHRSDASCLPPLTCDASLVAYWPLDEPAGSTAFLDASPNHNDGTCSQCPTAGVPGIRGNAVSFAGQSESIAVGEGPSLTDLSSGLSLLGWVELPNSEMFGYILSNDRDCSACGNYSGFSLWADQYNNGANIELCNGTELTEGPNAYPLSYGPWHFIAGTFDGSNALLYVDGLLQNSVAGVTLTAPPSFETQLGAMGYDQSYGLTGTVDEVMIFSRALTAAEISEMYAYYESL